MPVALYAENISHLALSHINPGITYCIYTLPHGIQSFGEKKVLMAFLSVGNVQKKVKYIEHQIVENHGLDGIEIFSLIILKLCFLKRL